MGHIICIHWYFDCYINITEIITSNISIVDEETFVSSSGKK